MIGCKINKLGLVNLTNILVDMYVLYFAYISSKIHWRKLFGRHINPQLFYQLYVDEPTTKSVGGSCLVVIQSPQPFYQEDIGDTNQHVAITINLATNGTF